MKDRLLYVIGAIIGLIACVPLWFVRVIGVIFSILWFAIIFILLGLCKLENLLEMALTGEEPEGDVIDEMINAMTASMEIIKESIHK